MILLQFPLIATTTQTQTQLISFQLPTVVLTRASTTGNPVMAKTTVIL